MSAPTLDRTDCRNRMGAAYGNWYWANRKGSSMSKDKPARVALILEYRKYRELLKTAPPEVDQYGNTLYRDFDADSFLGIKRAEDRYYYDFGPMRAWAQYDTKQDASYFGVWVNTEKLMVFSYCEGDRTLTVCPTAAALSEELARMASFYGPPPPAFVCYDLDAKTRTEYFDERPK